MPHQSAHCYEFGPYRLDLGQRMLTRAGDKVALTPKATHLLSLLVSNAGALVDKDELLKEVWRDTFVEESNLTQNIFLLRRALGDERPGARYIETVARRGYRFVASVRVIDSDSESDGPNGHTVSEPRIIAVLPLVNATGDADVEYVADGLTENLVNNLSRVSQLRVMSRSAVFRYKKKHLDPRVIGKELGVDVVLLGKISSRSSGQIGPQSVGIAIGLELVEVSKGWQLWGESFDCELKDLLEIQDTITRQLLAALKLKLSGDEEKRVTARHTENAEAYQSYLEGRYHWSKYTRTGIEKAVGHFRQAIELDPNYALAYAGIIDCYLRLATNYLPPEEDLYKPAEVGGVGKSDTQIADNSEHTDSTHIETEARIKLRFEWDWKVAERELNRALELRYDYPAAHQWYAAYRFAQTLFEQTTGSSDNKTSTESRLPNQIVSGEPTTAEQLQILCAVAREQIAVCNYEAAELVLQQWIPQNDWPKLGSLKPQAAADLLFTLGLLTSSLATTKQTTNGHRRAASLLNGSIALFENLNAKSRSVEARAELARCYYRQGLFDIARETLSAALSELPADRLEIKCLCLIYFGMLERDAGRLMDAISKLREAATVMGPAGRLVTARYHLELAGTLRDLALAERQHNDEIRLHYATALYETYAIGDHRTTAIAENNLGFLLLTLGAWDESEQHLLRARRFFEALGDNSRRAQVNETLTRLYIATNRYSLADQTIDEAIQVLERTEGEAILSEALTTSGIVRCRLDRIGSAQKAFEAAYQVSERCGDREGARRALLSMYEEMGERLDLDELGQILEKLKKLQALTEASSLVERVAGTISRIEALIAKMISSS
jgi:DNA-binding winged helix-turn-helix (wHTH) protein/tetratricopeptide (TPR) repeat protein